MLFVLSLGGLLSCTSAAPNPPKSTVVEKYAPGREFSEFENWLSKELSVQPAELTNSRLSAVRKLTIPDLDLQTLAGLERCTSLESLIIGCQYKEADDVGTFLDTDMSAVRSLKKLKTLTLDCAVNLDSRIFDDLDKLTALRIHTVTGLDLSFFGGMNSLTTLEFRCYPCQNEHWEGLAGLQNLQELTVDGCLMDDTAVDSFLPSLTELETLRFSNNILTRLDWLAELEHLKIIDVSGNQLKSEEALRQIEDLRHRGVQIVGLGK